MVELFLKSGRVERHVDDGIQAVDDTHAVSTELSAIWVVYVDSLEESLGCRDMLEQAEDKIMGMYIETSCKVCSVNCYCLCTLHYIQMSEDSPW